LEDGTQTTTIARPPTDPHRKKRRYWPLVLAIVLLLALAGGAYAVAAMYGSGAQEVTVPDVVGKLQVDADAVLSKAGLKPKPVPEASATVEIGRVVHQDPQKGTKQPEGTEVTIYISTGPAKSPDTTSTTQGATVTVPNVVGKTETEATNLLKQQGFVVDVKPMASDKPNGTVFDQSPAAGKSVLAGATVTIYVSNSTTVPDVSGDTLAAATAALNNSNLVPNVKYQASSSASVGHVIGQDPLPGISVAEHSTVTITIGTGPATTTSSSTTTTTSSGTSTTTST
jgi:serine/threonine-protein kinase